MNKEFELGHEGIKFERDINGPETEELPASAPVSELELESKKEPGPDHDSEETESEYSEKSESVFEKYQSAKEHKSKMGLWNDMLEKHKEDMEKEEEERDFKRAAEEERGLQNMQN